MIFSSIYAKDDMKKYPKPIQTALEYLKSNDFTAMEPGVYEIQGKEIYAQVMDAQTAPAEEKRPEVHESLLTFSFWHPEESASALHRIQETTRWTSALTREI